MGKMSDRDRQNNCCLFTFHDVLLFKLQFYFIKTSCHVLNFVKNKNKKKTLITYSVVNVPNTQSEYPLA